MQKFIFSVLHNNESVSGLLFIEIYDTKESFNCISIRHDERSMVSID